MGCAHSSGSVAPAAVPSGAGQTGKAVSASRLRALLSGSKRAERSPLFYTIKDKYESLDDVTEGLRAAGLESSNLIIAVGASVRRGRRGGRSGVPREPPVCP